MLTIQSLRAALAAAVIGAPCAVASADIITFSVTLDGPSESPPVASPGTGTGQVTIDTVLNTMRVQVSWADLVGTTTVAHIHAATAVPLAGAAGVATSVPTFAGFPAGVTAGSYDQTFDMTLASSYNPAFITNNGGTVDSARTALFVAMLQGRSYLNIHSSFSTSGEIRGFLVPSPGAVCLLVLAGLCATRRRR